MTVLQTVLLSFATALAGSSFAGIAYGYYAKRRDEKRSLYSKGLKLLSEREELYYMILRRGKGNSTRKLELVNLMHHNQTEISNHQAVLEVDSYWVGASYRNATSNFRTLTEQLFRDAWKDPLKNPYDPVPKSRRIDTSGVSQMHAKDCRRRLSPARSLWNTATRWFRK